MARDRDPELHSAAYFGAERDFWWNIDFLGLVAARLGLERARSALDVGAGLGHWGRALAHVLAPAATVAGVEREAGWVQEAQRRAASSGLGDRFRYQAGVAQALPFEDGSFDLVTCQTLLIHVPNPRVVIREMLRVTKPGGLVLVAEPNNRASLLVDTSETATASVDERLDLVRFGLTCERGKAALGEGDNSIGDLLPGYFAQEGAIDIHGFLSDKAAVMVPPYSGEEQQTLKAHYLRQSGTGGFGWSREEAERFFLAGGGTPGEFDASWQRRTRETARTAQAIRDGSLHSVGGGIFYLISGRRPS